jgi:uncharacterized membrane protein YccC
MSRKIIAAIVAYLIGFVLTFGFAYNHDYEQPGQFFDPNIGRAMFCAVAWPIYLSKVAFEGIRP